jgi:hypothetical protein
MNFVKAVSFTEPKKPGYYFYDSPVLWVSDDKRFYSLPNLTLPLALQKLKDETGVNAAKNIKMTLSVYYW